MKRPITFTIRTIVFSFNIMLIVLLLLAGVVVARRLTEAMTVRQTELILLSQGMVLSQVIQGRMEQALGTRVATYGTALKPDPPWATLTQEEKERLTQDPVQPRLDPIFSRPIVIQDSWEVQEAPAPDQTAEKVGREVTPLLLAARESTLTGLRLVDWQGIVVGSTSGGQGRSLAHWEEVGQALSGRTATRMYQRQMAPGEIDAPDRRTYRIHVALPLIKDRRCLGALVLIREPLNIPLTQLSDLQEYLILASSLILTVVVLFAVLTALTISLPIGALLRQTERFAGGDRKSLEPLAHPITDEMDRLSRGFVGMAQALEDRSEYILTFARELSHAFKPSLATIQMRLEFLEETEGEEPSPEERRRHLAIIREEAARLEQKTARAMEWARADAGLPTGASAPVNQMIEEIADRYQARNVNLNLDLDPRVSRAGIATDDLDKIVVNLVDNALQHGGPDVTIEVKTRPAVGNQMELTVADNGPGISEANRDKVFKVFFTTAPEKGGTGLGLSIVRSLVKAHDGEITLSSSPDFATVFTIRLPAR
jgi:signal transduction histidine kinase